MKAAIDSSDHHEIVNVTTTGRPRILMVVANPSVSTTLGGPVGFWGAELTHPYFEFTSKADYEVTIASPGGGGVEMDALSDPRDESRWSADDLVTMGFVNTPELAQLLDDTPKLSELDYGAYDAIVVCGGQSPMYTFRENPDLKEALRAFYEAEKPTACFCHGVAALCDVELSDGSFLVEGKTLTGFSNEEEDWGNAAVGQEIMPWKVEDVLRERGANYIHGGLFRSFAVRDGRLFTGQQQYSGQKVAQMLIEAVGV